jgi:phospholipase/carboxylesterase
MDDAALDDLRVFLPPLLRAMEGLGFVARRLDPPQLARVLAIVAEPHAALQAVRPRVDGWPEDLAPVRERLTSVADEALAAYEELTAAEDMRGIYRALRHVPRAQEAFYPLADGLPPVSRYFLSPPRRDDAELLGRLDAAPVRDDVGVFHVDNEPGARGGFSLYVPETYDPDLPHPVVFALHGGAGNGRGFLWSWVRDARAAGAILVAPTAVGDTWALQGQDADSPNLERILTLVTDRWNVDPARRLLTGMSDGGTFSYISGLVEGSPFTHLAPACAAFHPMLTAFADADRIRGLPIHVTHGAQDWMFAVDMAREAQAALTAAGANVTYREIEDLSHCYPTEVNPDILAWMDATA